MLEYEIDRIEHGDPITVVMTHSTGVVRPVGSDDETTSSHRSAFVLRHTGEEWLITVYMYNSA